MVWRQVLQERTFEASVVGSGSLFARKDSVAFGLVFVTRDLLRRVRERYQEPFGTDIGRLSPISSRPPLERQHLLQPFEISIPDIGEIPGLSATFVVSFLTGVDHYRTSFGGRANMDHAFHTEAPERAATTIARCVSDALQAYLEGLHGHEPGNIFHMVLREVERPLFEVALSRAGGNIGRAAQILGMNRYARNSRNMT
jgi:Fis family transcriptional regulator, factor for inversion stimulation protein